MHLPRLGGTRGRAGIVMGVPSLGVTSLVLCVMMTSRRHGCGAAAQTAQYFTDQWAVRVEGDESVARQVASRHGFAYVDRVSKVNE